ncbi:MAG: aspartate aminotransferase [Chlamydiales bacterium]|jgi:aspartate aminotransferase
MSVYTSDTIKPTVSPAKRTKQAVNPIRVICRQIPVINKERETLGLDPLIDLTIGQPHIPMNTAILEKLIEKLQEIKDLPREQITKEMGYSNSSGLPEAREAISRFYNYTYPEVKAQDPFTPEEVIVCNGAAGGMVLALKTLIEDSDVVASISPCFPAYYNQIEDCGGTLAEIRVSPDSSFAETIDFFLSQRPKVKAFIWNDPNNPLGTKQNRKSLEDVAKVLRMYPNLIIIHDEVYREIVHNGPCLSLINVAPDLKNRSIIIRSLAKELAGAPGIRGGMVSAPTALLSPRGEHHNIIQYMSNEQLRDTVSVNVFTQHALIIALEEKMNGNSDKWERMIQNEYRQNVQYMSNLLTQEGLPPLYKPEGAFYIVVNAKAFLGKEIPDTLVVDNDDGTGTKYSNLHEMIGSSTLENDIHISTFLLHIAGVATVPGSGFGLKKEDATLRISCANTLENLRTAVEQMSMAKSLL